MRNTFFLAILLPIVGFGQTTDTVGFMHYNVLNYRNITTFCTMSNNNPTDKEGYMNTIVGYLLPDIITVNELASDGGITAKRLLDNALNKDGRQFYQLCAYSANSNLSNMLYYNRNKFALRSQDKILRAPNNTFLVRQIDVYKLYYLDTKKLARGDTTFLNVYVTHLKAGSTSADKAERLEMTQSIMAYHSDNYSRENYIIAGDFNVQSASEQSYQELVDNSNSLIRFKDPLERSGSWNNNSLYAPVHTQSTRSSSNGCASSGGLDDRFDFILCGQEVLDGSYGVTYVLDSYTAVGNDGKKFNNSILDVSNSSVPGTVLSALFNMSDHLPVYMELSIGRSVTNVSEPTFQNYLILNNPIQNKLQWKLQYPRSGRFTLTDMQGKVIYSHEIGAVTGWITRDLSNLNAGMYYVTFEAENNEVIRRKVLKL